MMNKHRNSPWPVSKYLWRTYYVLGPVQVLAILQ